MSRFSLMGFLPSLYPLFTSFFFDYICIILNFNECNMDKNLNFLNSKQLEAVKKSGRALEYASEELKSNRAVVLEAVKQNGFGYCLTSKSTHFSMCLGGFEERALLI